MIRGTTPTLIFTLPLDTNLIEEAYITIAQNGEVVIDKNYTDCAIGERSLTLKLSQEETLLLDARERAEIQIRVRTTTGDALASNIIKVSTGRILKDGVI